MKWVSEWVSDKMSKSRSIGSFLLFTAGFPGLCFTRICIVMMYYYVRTINTPLNLFWRLPLQPFAVLFQAFVGSPPQAFQIAVSSECFPRVQSLHFPACCLISLCSSCRRPCKFTPKIDTNLCQLCFAETLTCTWIRWVSVSAPASWSPFLGVWDSCGGRMCEREGASSIWRCFLLWAYVIQLLESLP